MSTSPRPPLITRADKTVPVTVFARTTAPPADTFEIIAPIDLATVFHPVFPFPGVTEVRNQTESWDHPGPSRTPTFDDGSQATERLTEYVASQGFAYELTEFTNVLGRLAAGVRGEWSFLPDGDGCLIRWTYEFKPLRGRRLVLAGPFRPLWRRYMQRALDRMVDVVEAR
ncbi:SRPBCC family protein [Nocardioides pantholopis]|uniref:SRPBCC family protein n=1 Tax=Nocardioides pantholopis TaxID=2483798 RepID=UPI000FD9A007|nr:SRPBCC family protein [Nocardioides pantholopis]